MTSIKDIAEKFVSLAQASPYSQVIALQRAMANVWLALSRAKRTDGSSDPKAEKLARELYGVANRMLYNANKYGLTASTSAGFARSVESKLDALLEHLAGQNPYADVVTMTQDAASSAKRVMESFLPRSLPAQKKEEIKDAPKPEPKKEETGEGAMARIRQMQDAERMSLKPESTIPAPPGSGFSRIPAVDVVPEAGIAYPKESPKPTSKPFVPGRHPFAPVPEAGLGSNVELPKTGPEAELAKWQARIETFVKLAK